MSETSSDQPPASDDNQPPVLGDWRTPGETLGERLKNAHIGHTRPHPLKPGWSQTETTPTNKDVAPQQPSQTGTAPKEHNDTSPTATPTPKLGIIK